MGLSPQQLSAAVAGGFFCSTILHSMVRCPAGRACLAGVFFRLNYLSNFYNIVKEKIMNDKWLVSLETADAQSGYELAIKLSRMGVKYTQPSDEVRSKLRAVYSENADSLIACSQVIAINFQTIAAANNYWRS
jgi:hypothetical protein